MPDHDYAALAAEGRRLWAEFLTFNVTQEAMWAWFDLHHDALLTAVEQLAAMEKRCAELAAALETAKGLMAWNDEQVADNAANYRKLSDSLLDPATILREHDAALIEKVRGAILRECDLGPDDRNTVVRTNDIEDAFNKVRKGEL